MAISQTAWRGRSAHLPDAPAFDSSSDMPRFRTATPGRSHGKPDIQPSKSWYQSLWSLPARFRRMDSIQEPTREHPPIGFCIGGQL